MSDVTREAAVMTTSATALPPATRVSPSAPTPSRVPGSRPRRRLGRYSLQMLALVLFTAVGAVALRYRTPALPAGPIRLAPHVVYSSLRLDGALVLGASRSWAVNRTGPARYGDPVPVSITAYCLKGLTRRDNYVRQGIVAADPRMFPLARFLEIYVGREYWGRFLIDDTGGVIKGNKLDIWTPTCREARIFGRQRGTAVLVPRPSGVPETIAMTGRFGGPQP